MPEMLKRFEQEAYDSWDAMRREVQVAHVDGETRDIIAAYLVLAARIGEVRHQLNHGITTYVPEEG